MLKPRLRMALVLAAGTLIVSSCDSGDTIVSVNYSFDDATAGDVKMNATSLHITIKPSSGSEVTTDYQLMRDADSGAITSASYKRVTVNGMSGPATVTVIAKDSGGSELLKAIPNDPALAGSDPSSPKDLQVDVVAHGAIAAYLKFAKPVVVMPDAGASSGSGGSSSDGSGGSGSGGSGSGGSGG